MVVDVDNTWSVNAFTIKLVLPLPPAPPPAPLTNPANGLLIVILVRLLIDLARKYTYPKKTCVTTKYVTKAYRAIRTALTSNISILFDNNITPTVIIICCIAGGCNISSYSIISF